MNKRILVVEDTQNIREILLEILDGAGYTVVGATNGAEALDRARIFKPDLILIDLLMPVMDGAALITQLAVDTKLSRVPRVLMTATPSLVTLPLRQLARVVLQKPVLREALLRIVANCLAP